MYKQLGRLLRAARIHCWHLEHQVANWLSLIDPRGDNKVATVIQYRKPIIGFDDPVIENLKLSRVFEEVLVAHEVPTVYRRELLMTGSTWLYDQKIDLWLSGASILMGPSNFWRARLPFDLSHKAVDHPDLNWIKIYATNLADLDLTEIIQFYNSQI